MCPPETTPYFNPSEKWGFGATSSPGLFPQTMREKPWGRGWVWRGRGGGGREIFLAPARIKSNFYVPFIAFNLDVTADVDVNCRDTVDPKSCM